LHVRPVLIMDDLGSELGAVYVQRLLDALPHGVQYWISTVALSTFASARTENAHVLNLDRGQLA
jgi:recombinational DNA repair ATPase RecF